MRKTMPIKESKDIQLYSALLTYVVSKAMLLQLSDANYLSWTKYILGCAILCLQLVQTLVEAELDGHLTLNCVPCLYNVDEWSKTGTEANTTLASTGVEMPRLTNDKRNSDEHTIRPAHSSHNSLTCIRAGCLWLNVDSFGRFIPFEEHEDVVKDE